jgi:O-antigen/teichoic acid export membrane protein
MAETSAATGEARTLGHDVGLVASSTFISAAARALAGIVAARYVPPAGLGLYAAILLLPTYGSFLHLGVLDGLQRDIPIRLGQGDADSVRRIAATAQAWVILVAGALAGAILLGASRFLDPRLEAGLTGLVASAFLVFEGMYAQQYLTQTYRATRSFRSLASIQVAVAVLFLAATPLVAIWHVHGLWYRTALVAVVEGALLWRFRPIRTGAKWCRDELRRLLATGFPIFASNLVGVAWVALDRGLVLAVFGTRGLGLYSLSVAVSGVLATVTISLKLASLPSIGHEYGRRPDVRGATRVLLGPLLKGVLLLCAATALTWIALPTAVRLVLPAYVDGVPAARWGAVCASVESLMVVTNVLVVLNRAWVYGIAYLVGMVVYGAAVAGLLWRGAGLDAFPKAMTIGRGVAIVICALAVSRLARSTRTPSASSSSRPARRQGKPAGGNFGD